MSIKGSKLRMATIYKQYVNGFSYIPLQDLPLYEKAYKEVYND